MIQLHALIGWGIAEVRSLVGVLLKLGFGIKVQTKNEN